MSITSFIQGRAYHARQKGVVLLITLIMLVAMTLAAIALMRSVDTSNLVAGNMAFEQSSLNVADLGTEQAITYLYQLGPNGLPGTTCDGSTLSIPVQPATSRTIMPNRWKPPYTTWESYWTSMMKGPGVVIVTRPAFGLHRGFHYRSHVH